jgi:hypothetical protein
VAGWVKWGGGGEWERIFNFGRNDQDYFFLTPSDSSNLVHYAITTDVSVYNQIMESPSAFPANQWTYVAVVMDVCLSLSTSCAADAFQREGAIITPSNMLKSRRICCYWVLLLCATNT